MENHSAQASFWLSCDQCDASSPHHRTPQLAKDEAKSLGWSITQFWTGIDLSHPRHLCHYCTSNVKKESLCPTIHTGT